MSRPADVSEYLKCYILQAFTTSDVQTHSHVQESAQTSLWSICVSWNDSGFFLTLGIKRNNNESHAVRSDERVNFDFALVTAELNVISKHPQSITDQLHLRTKSQKNPPHQTSVPSPAETSQHHLFTRCCSFMWAGQYPRQGLWASTDTSNESHK